MSEKTVNAATFGVQITYPKTVAEALTSLVARYKGEVEGAQEAHDAGGAREFGIKLSFAEDLLAELGKTRVR